MRELIQAHVFVSGKVQGVFYRQTAANRAEELGVRGWVRNLPDRRVEAVFQGSPTAIAAMIEWCRQGPPAARVQEVTVEYRPPTPLEGFQILD